jgi:DNA polymerase (family 10)
MNNKDIASIFEEMADLLEILGDDIYKIRAYRKAALNINAHSQPLLDLYKNDFRNFKDIAGVGDQIAKKIEEILLTGRLKKHDVLLKKVTPAVLELLKVPGLGPKHVKVLRDKLKVKNIEDLKKACLKDKVSQLEGFGEKSEENILTGITEYKQLDKRMNLKEADLLAASIIDYLKKSKIAISRLEIAGSLRRGRETVGDIDILASSKEPDKLRNYFIKYTGFKTILANGQTKVSVITKSEVQIDLRLVEESCFGSAWVHFTGSQAHNVHLRKIAKFKKLKVNEYGVFDKKKNIASKKEEDVYRVLGLKYIPPALREDNMEIEAAEAGKLPKLINFKDLKGDVHIHTTASDGRSSIAEMAQEARKIGLKYIAITEHSKAVKVANGLSEKQLFKHLKKIDDTQKKFKDIRILKGAEVDIEKDGKLNLDDSVLKELDIVIGAIHFRYDLSKQEMTNRILKAMDNRYVNIIAHPTGRLIGERNPYELDFEIIFSEAHKKNIALELNSAFDKLDLKDSHCRMAKDFNVKVVINSDSHSRQGMQNLKYGIITARRGWLEAKDVLNTMETDAFLKAIKRK